MNFKEFLNELITHTPLPVIDPTQRNKPGVQKQLAKRSAAAVARTIPNQDLVKLKHAGSVNASRTYYLTKAGAKFISEKVKDKTVPMLAKMVLTSTNKRGSKVNPMRAISASQKAGVGSEVARTVKSAS